MIETLSLARAQSSYERPPTWTRPPLPRGPSPLLRRIAKARALVAGKLARRRAPQCC